MAIVIGVRFANNCKVYYFDPSDVWPAAGDSVICDTVRGPEFGVVASGSREVSDDLLQLPLRKVIRMATAGDVEHNKANMALAREATLKCKDKIIEHGLEMKLIDVEVAFDNSKIVFYFTANERVDFRDLVKDLAAIYKTRIELRQVGVRDEARMLGGLGPCGRPICCGTCLSNFQPVSIKMAKEQNLSLNPTKISGLCGRLMCCLKYEEDYYEMVSREMPRVGKDVMTPDGLGTVIGIDVLTEKVRVRIQLPDNSYDIRTYKNEECERRDRAQSKPRPESEAPAAQEKPIEAAEYAPQPEPAIDVDDDDIAEEYEQESAGEDITEEIQQERTILELVGGETGGADDEYVSESDEVSEYDDVPEGEDEAEAGPAAAEAAEELEEEIAEVIEQVEEIEETEEAEAPDTADEAPAADEYEERAEAEIPGITDTNEPSGEAEADDAPGANEDGGDIAEAAEIIEAEAEDTQEETAEEITEGIAEAITEEITEEITEAVETVEISDDESAMDDVEPDGAETPDAPETADESGDEAE